MIDEPPLRRGFLLLNGAVRVTIRGLSVMIQFPRMMIPALRVMNAPRMMIQPLRMTIQHLRVMNPVLRVTN